MVQQKYEETKVEIGKCGYHSPEPLIWREYLIKIRIQIAESTHENDDS